jgi:chromosome segregation ATPase
MSIYELEEEKQRVKEAIEMLEAELADLKKGGTPEQVKEMEAGIKGLKRELASITDLIESKEGSGK